MKRSLGIGGAAIAALLFASPVMADEEEYEFAPLPPGEGAEVVYYNCIACHSLRTVTNQRFSRRIWDEVLDWMRETQGMHDLGDDREIILDYLATHLGPESE